MVEITRRGAIVGGLAGLCAGSSLTACSSGTSDEDVQKANSSTELPTYSKYEGVEPDWKGDDVLLDGFKKYPQDPVQEISDPPGDGETISFITNIPGAIPPQVDANPYWQALNKKIGSDLAIEMAPNADYDTKFQTKVASGDLPDLLNVPPTTTDLPGLLSSSCMDITELVSGDAILKYPFLANIGPEYWKACVADGKIYGVPVPRLTSRNFMVLTRRDLLEQRGVDPDVQPETWDEFVDLCKEVTDEKNSSWALTSVPANVAHMSVGIPTNWHREEDGTFTHYIEHESMPASLEAQIQLFEAGVVNPDAFTANASTKKDWFSGGAAVMDYDSFVAWTQYEQTNVDVEEFSVGGITLLAGEGTEPVQWLGAPINNITAFSADSKHSPETLLAVANWFAAPFGTAEYLFNKYGVEGEQYELEGTDPVLTSSGVQQVGIGQQYISDAPMAFYFPGKPDVPERQYGVQERMSQNLSKDDSVGLFSSTKDQKAAELESPVWDAMNQMVMGRRSVSEYADVVTTWRENGGAQIAEELATAYENSGIG